MNKVNVELDYVFNWKVSFGFDLKEYFCLFYILKGWGSL